MAIHVVVLGAGVIGCSVAVNIAELCDDVVVTLMSETFTPHTTSDRSGASLQPRNLTGNEQEAIRVNRWSKATLQYMDSLYAAGMASQLDLQYIHGYYATQRVPPNEDPWWLKDAPGFRHASRRERDIMSIPDHFPSVYTFNMYVLNCRHYLPWMMEQFAKAGGITERRRVNSLEELSSYHLVINCTGLGSAALVDDEELYPVKGDAVLVEAPWIKQFLYLITKDTYTYLFPRRDGIVLGGTFKYNDWSEGIDEVSSSDVLRRACEGVPSLADAWIKEMWSALRPVRERIRVEVDEGNRNLIHCYGHGGQGVALHWGCALEVTEMVRQWAKENRPVSKHTTTKSKL